MKNLLLLSLFPLILGSAFKNTDFYAYYTKIDSGQSWEKHSRTARHADLVVRMGEGEVIFHRSSSYLPYWDTGSKLYYFWEMVKRRGDGPEGRPDKNNLYSYVRLIQISSLGAMRSPFLVMWVTMEWFMNILHSTPI
jgi:hypothetical protein